MGNAGAKGIESQLKGKDIILFVLSKSDYSDKLMDVVKSASNQSSGICYVSANRPAKALIKLFDAEKIGTKTFQFIDCISQSAAGEGGSKKDACNNVILYVSSPGNLTELSITINGALSKGRKTDAVLVDALTTFLIYEQGLTVIRFAHNLISNLRQRECKGFFIALRNDISSSLLDDLSMFVDGVVDI